MPQSWPQIYLHRAQASAQRATLHLRLWLDFPAPAGGGKFAASPHHLAMPRPPPSPTRQCWSLYRHHVFHILCKLVMFLLCHCSPGVAVCCSWLKQKVFAPLLLFHIVFCSSRIPCIPNKMDRKIGLIKFKDVFNSRWFFVNSLPCL